MTVVNLYQSRMHNRRRQKTDNPGTGTNISIADANIRTNNISQGISTVDKDGKN